MSLGFHHTLKTNQSNERIRHLLVFDVESRLSPGDKNRTYFEPFLWTLIYSRYRPETNKFTQHKHWGTELTPFWDTVEHYTWDRQKTVLSSHHLEPDFIPLHGIYELPARGWLLHRYITHNRILYFEFVRGARKLIVTNSGNIFPGSMADWGTSLGLPKLDMPELCAPQSDWVAYCMRDAEILTALWHKYFEFLDLHDLGNLKFTAASQAMTSYRHRFMRRPIAIHQHPDTLALERSSYHGGRFEALYYGNPGKPRYWRLDINSMYAHIMSQNPLPYELRGYSPSATLQSLTWALSKYQVVANLTIQCNKPFFPVTIDAKIAYQPGIHQVTFTTPEILYLLEHGSILQVGAMAWYKYDYILRDYANYFLSLRAQYKQEHNHAFEQLAKLFVNSLYGKFGQYGYTDKIIGECDPSLVKYEESYDLTTRQKIGYFFYGGKIRVTLKTGVSYNTLVTIASHITAIGRLKLWQLMSQAGLDHVYHVATDSLIVDAIGLQRLQDHIHPSQPGRLKIEQEFTNLIIKAPNDMMIDGLEKIKGVSKKATKLDDDTYQITAWPHFNTLLKHSELEQYYTRSVTKTLQRPAFKSLTAN
ncbi:MAG: DNA polymerase [Candidatus Zixiibacteriota bacterium]